MTTQALIGREPASGDVAERIRDRVEVAVIGAGQAGLSISHELTKQGRDHIVLERATRLAEPWRNRWDSFTLVTPNWALQLAGFPYRGGNPDGYMDRDEVVRYFEDYAASFKPPVRFGVTVTGVDAHPSGEGFVVTTDAGILEADNVVVATGMFQRPRMPSAAVGLPPDIVQVHSSQYRKPEALPPGAVLVVGTAQSGAQIAEELYRRGRQVYLSVGRAGRAPRRYRGRDVFWWLVQIRFFDQPLGPDFVPPHVSGRDGGRTLNLHRFARDGVQLLGRVQGTAAGRLRFAPDLHENLAKADGFAMHATTMIDDFIAKSRMEAPPPDNEPPLRDGFAAVPREELDLAAAGITSIVWATGYERDFSWVRFPVFDERGFLVQQDGATAVPGLSFAGLATPKASTMVGVGNDAAQVVEAIAAHAHTGDRAPAGVGRS